VEHAACRRPRRRVGLAQQRRIAQPPHGAALALWLRWQLEAALLRPQADALYRKRGVKEQQDGRGASYVDGVAARDDAHEEVGGEVEEAGGRAAACLARERRRRRGRGGASGGAGQMARTLALTQVHHRSRLRDSCEDGEALSSVHSTALAAGKLRGERVD